MEAKLGQYETLLCLPFWTVNVKYTFASETWKKTLKSYKMLWHNTVYIEEWHLIKIKQLLYKKAKKQLFYKK